MDETFIVELFNASGATITGDRATVTILNDDTQSYFVSIEDATITEGSSDETTEVELTVSLSDASEEPITVDFMTVDETAIAPSDYAETSGTLTFNPGDPLTQIITISVLPDTDVELDETFIVELSNALGATITGDRATVTIVNDDFLLPSDILLEENSDFRVSLEQPVEIDNAGMILNFTYANLNFDTTDTNSINDAFEAALVDENGNSLVYTIGKGSNAFLNLTEGETAAIASGVTVDGETVSINLVGVPLDTTATLILRLVNNDGDTETFVSITDIEILPFDGDAPPPVTIPSDETTASPDIDFTRLSDVSSSLKAEYGQTSFNEQTSILQTEVAIENHGNYTADTPLLVAIDRISDPTVRIRNAAGETPSGLPYYDFSDLVSDGTLSPDEITDSKTISFYNPQGVQFTYSLVILSSLNADPEIESQPPWEIIGGQDYRYEVIATDADSDPLTYSLLTAPEGLAIDPNTGAIAWQTSTEDIANHNITIQVSDGRGGVAIQTFTLSVIAEPPNRPPIFISTPEVDAWINQLYTYDADAVDADNDTLTYSLQLVHQLASTITAFSKPVFKRICSNQHQSKFN